MECKCKYFLRNDDGKLYCTQCGKPAQDNGIEDKAESKAPLYVSKKDRMIPKGVRKIGG